MTKNKAIYEFNNNANILALLTKYEDTICKIFDMLPDVSKRIEAASGLKELIAEINSDSSNFIGTKSKLKKRIKKESQENTMILFILSKYEKIVEQMHEYIYKKYDVEKTAELMRVLIDELAGDAKKYIEKQKILQKMID